MTSVLERLVRGEAGEAARELLRSLSLGDSAAKRQADLIIEEHNASRANQRAIVLDDHTELIHSGNRTYYATGEGVDRRMTLIDPIDKVDPKKK